MMLGKICRRISIGTSERFRLSVTKRFFTTTTNNNKPKTEPNVTTTTNNNNNNKPKTEPNGEKNDASLTHHDSYRDLDKLDFMTATKILFTTPPKQKKFGLDFHLVQLFFVCLPSLAVYLVAQYARHEMKKMDAELERMKIEEAKKVKATEEDLLKSNPQLLEVKERLESLEKTVKEIVIESKNQRSTATVSEQHKGDKTQVTNKPLVENHSNKQAANKQETQRDHNQIAKQGDEK